MTKWVAVYCDGSRHQDTYKMTVSIAEDLRNSGIRDVRALPMREEIRTTCVKIRVVANDPEKWRGLRFDECIGFPNEVAMYIRKDHLPKNYDGSLIDYILKEERKEK